MTNKKFTKSELRRINLRWIWHSQIGWNYERMQGMGYLTAMLPVIEKLYGDRPELKQKALETHNVFFNTQPAMGDIIIGMNIAIEEQGQETGTGLEVASSLKVALMGPFAGIGDTIFGMVAGAVFGGIAASMASEGNGIGTFIWFIWMVATFFLRFYMFDLGYSQGIKLVTTLSSTMNAFTEAASVVGLVVVGGMVATMVKLPLGTIQGGKIGVDETGADIYQVFDLQSYADSIMPQLIPALLVGTFYWMLGKKWMNSNRLIIVVLAFALLLSFFGLVA